MMNHPGILVFRKAADVTYSGKVKAATVEAVVEMVSRPTVRVERPGLVEMMVPTTRGRSQFARLTPITEAERHTVAQWMAAQPVTKAEAKAAQAIIKAKSLTVPVDSLGRKGRTDQGTAESIRLWIKDRLAVAGAENGTTIIEAGGADLAMIGWER